MHPDAAVAFRRKLDRARDRWGEVQKLASFASFASLASLASLVTCSACGAPVPETTTDAVLPVSVRFEPSANAAQIPNVVHVHLTSSTLNSGAVALFEGAVSSYYLGKFKHGEVPSSLASRQVAVVSWRSGPELIVAPLRPLSLGPYSLISVDGLVAEFNVGVIQPVLDRFWPPAASAGSPQLAVYCRDANSAGALPEAAELLFEPGQLPVALAPGVDESGLFADRCRHLESEHALAPGEVWVPPAAVENWALSPAIFALVEPSSAELGSCQAGELTFGPGCASVADDRLTVRTPSAPLLWIVHTARGALVEVTHAGRPLIIDGLLPDTRERLWGSTRDLSGAARVLEVELHTAPARERPILNEALADALGPEPQSEWIEMLNDGTLAVDLAGYSLQDGGGRTPLPHAVLAPHEYALLVREDFTPNASDEPPAPAARLIRVPTLGKSGLSNAGERLSLVNTSGEECSALPAMAGKAGQSLARRTPSSSDDDPQAFSFGTPTPGVANTAPSTAP